MKENIPAGIDNTSAKLREILEFNGKGATASLPQKAVALARALQERANALQTPQERRQQAELDRMIQHPGDKVTLMQLTDQAFRSEVNERAADQMIHILDVQGVPRFFSPVDRTLLKGFQSFGSVLPGVAVPLVKSKMHRETANVILPAEREELARHLAERREEGVRMNVNFLGEALLGEEEAERRFKSYLHALQMPEIEVISVKISTIFSQISALARKHTIGQLCDRLEMLYRAAAKSRFERSDGSVVPKFVYLDMEEYRDLSITAEAFMQTLSCPELKGIAAGIALQAYIPDSFRWQQTLTDWAKQRVGEGGAPVTIRIVKGANMEMERVEASLAGWPQAPYVKKIETDANYKRMLMHGLRPENIPAVRLGIASHNLFDLAFGLVAAVEADALRFVQFEMLEGMANHQRRALFELVHNLLLYAPACKQDQFVNAIGYLVRRLDENTGANNFLRHAFKLKVGSDDWNELEANFLASFELIEGLTDAPRRTQDRRQPEPSNSAGKIAELTAFTNEPDTDFSLPHNSEWAEQLIADWLPLCDEHAIEVPIVVGGREIFEDREVRESLDPSRPETVVARYRHATASDAITAVACAKRDTGGWRELSAMERRETLARVADELRAARGTLTGAAMVEGGKILTESDPEVSEAVDFAEFYSLSAVQLAELEGIEATPNGVVVVVSPWNFPIAIPCGGIAAALAAGNTVILKPASDTVLVAYKLCQCFWRAGVSKEALQFLPCSGRDIASQLVSHDDVNAVILTGGTATARAMLDNKPDMNLLAETGGKNATIVTSLSDRDQAIKHVVQSAFGHCGQKCSATSLLILEQEVYDDPEFKEALCDAVESLHIGPAFELETKIGPLIRKPSGDLSNALKELEPGEEWAVLPERWDDNPQLYSPGVKWGVQPGGYTHTTEFFGPVLGVMKARNLDDAIRLANGTGYGLTSGLQSLDEREQDEWQQSVRTGNLYINRGTTGAIVLRQPFGGMGKSAFGPGIKAGGPNYVAQLMNFKDTETLARLGDDGWQEWLGEFDSGGISMQWTPPHPPVNVRHLVDFRDRLRELSETETSIDPKEIERVLASLDSYALAYREEFRRLHDHFHLLGQDNFRRYLPVRELRVRVHAGDVLADIFQRVAAAKTAGCRVTVSYTADADIGAITLLDDLTESWAGAIEFVEETDDQLAAVIRSRDTDRVRYGDPSRVPLIIRQAAPEVELYLADRPVLQQGRIELLWYLQEQSLCVDYHRYGNLGARTMES